MALISCFECGTSISDRAPSCPQCGAPRQISSTTPTVATQPPRTLISAGEVSFGRRLSAGLIDFGVLAFCFFLSFFAGPQRDMLVGLPMLLLFLIPETTKKRGTVGKRSLGLVVCSPDGLDVPWWRRLARALLKLIAFYAFVIFYTAVFFGLRRATTWTLVPPVLAIAYVLTPLLNKRRQCLHDMITGCAVQRRLPSDQAMKSFRLYRNG